MKKIFLITCFFLCLPVLSNALTERELFDKGMRHFKNGEFKNSIEAYTELIQISPENARAYKNRGVAHMQLMDFDAAIKDFNQALQIFPELRGLYSNLGSAWFYKKDYTRALENYQTAIKLEPENHLAYFNRALCLLEQKQYAPAMEDLDQTLKLKPDLYPAICCRADILVHFKKYTQAAAEYQSAIRLQPEIAYARDRLAEIQPRLTKSSKSGQPAGGDEKKYRIQVGAFLNDANAQKMVEKMQENGFPFKIIPMTNHKGKTWYLVRSDIFSLYSRAQKERDEIKSRLGIAAVIRTAGSW